MYSQIYSKRPEDKSVVTFPNHSAIEQMKNKSSTESTSEIISQAKTNSAKELCTDEILLLAAMLAFGSSKIDSDLFTLIAAAIICT